MKKHKVSENSLKNLEKGKAFSADNAEVARECQKKATQKRKQNKAMRIVAEAKLNELFSDGQTFQEKAIDLIAKRTLEGKVKNDDLIKLITFLRDTAGQKPADVVENVAPPVIEIKGINI